MHAIEIQLTTKDTSIDPAGEPVTISGHGDTITDAAFDLILQIEALFGEWDMPAQFELRDAIRRLESGAMEIDVDEVAQYEPGYTLRLVRAA